MEFPAIRGRILSDTMGDPRHGRPGGHRGQDIQAPLHSPVVAAKHGTVRRVYDRLTPDGYCGYGLSVEDTDEIRWTYCHFARPPTHEDGTPWHVGETVNAGDFLGIVGTTTRQGASVGPHLHVQAITASGAGHALNLFEPLRAAYARMQGLPVAPHHDYASGIDEPEPEPHGASSAASSAIPLALIAAAVWFAWSKGGR